MHKPTINRQPVQDEIQDRKQIKIHSMLNQKKNLATVSSQSPMSLLHRKPNLLPYSTCCAVSTNPIHETKAMRNTCSYPDLHTYCRLHKIMWILRTHHHTKSILNYNHFYQLQKHKLGSRWTRFVVKNRYPEIAAGVYRLPPETVRNSCIQDK